MKKYDMIRFYGYRLQKLHQRPIVIHPNQTFSRKSKVDLTLIFNKANAPLSIVEPVFNQVGEGGQAQIKERVGSVFEFSRISEESLSMQSTFINLWIALESFVQTKEYQGDIETIKNIVSAAELDHYLYGLIRNFYEDCQRCDISLSSLKGEFGTQLSSKQKVRIMLDVLTDDSLKEKLINECEKWNTLLGYRCQCLIHHFEDGKKRFNGKASAACGFPSSTTV
ncbi:hypothetical protein QS257_18285 [Terrilactibacillus sp. S3-3]|nr:hypothetical protein QS257_18285 [Terrilactibacillus sp. S3-3]